MAINAPIQGTQADSIKLAMVRVDEMLEKENAHTDAYLLLQVHDELVYEIRIERVAALGVKIKRLWSLYCLSRRRVACPSSR